MSPDGRGRPLLFEALDWLTQGEISELAAHFWRIKLWRLEGVKLRVLWEEPSISAGGGVLISERLSWW